MRIERILLMTPEQQARKLLRDYADGYVDGMDVNDDTQFSSKLRVVIDGEGVDLTRYINPIACVIKQSSQPKRLSVDALFKICQDVVIKWGTGKDVRHKHIEGEEPLPLQLAQAIYNAQNESEGI